MRSQLIRSQHVMKHQMVVGLGRQMITCAYSGGQQPHFPPQPSQQPPQYQPYGNGTSQYAAGHAGMQGYGQPFPPGQGSPIPGPVTAPQPQVTTKPQPLEQVRFDDSALNSVQITGEGGTPVCLYCVCQVNCLGLAVQVEKVLFMTSFNATLTGPGGL